MLGSRYLSKCSMWLCLALGAGAAHAGSPDCAGDNAGLSLPTGFCASVFADGIGHARHLAVSPAGIVYVNTWSGAYYDNPRLPPGGFLVALQDTHGTGHADRIERFGSTRQGGGAGGSGIAIHQGRLFAEIDDKIVRYELGANEFVPAAAPVTVVSGLPLGGDHPMHPFIIDADGGLFVDVASASNACQPKNRQPQVHGDDPCRELQTRGGVWRYDANKTGQRFSPAERYATGIRNAEGFALDSSGRHVYVTQHGRDQLHSNWPQLYKPEEEATLPAEEVMLLTTPLPHSSGYHMVAGFLQGAHVVIEDRFDPQRFFELCRDLGVTWTMMVPTMLYRLLDHPAAGSDAHHSLSTIVYGAAPINRERLEEGLRKFGKVFLQIYGQTECPNLIATLSKDDHTNPDLLASCGRAVPLVELRLRPDESGAGEVEVRSPYLLTEYFRDPVATQEALQDGWLRTGDLARLEDGYLFLVDRAKDMIISGGMNVYSTEVESVLREHPNVREAAVVGVPHPDWGEAVTAVVIVEEGSDPEEIRQFAKARLSAYKAPKSVHIIAEMPLTQYGKIDKRAIRARLIKAVEGPLG